MMNQELLFALVLLLVLLIVIQVSKSKRRPVDHNEGEPLYAETDIWGLPKGENKMDLELDHNSPPRPPRSILVILVIAFLIIYLLSGIALPVGQ